MLEPRPELMLFASYEMDWIDHNNFL
jgi:hypothetical protein